jgi:Flp pilus assembly protein TadG
MSGFLKTADRARGDEGTAVVEFALVLPFLALFVLGIVEYGMAYHEADLFERGLNVAARTASNSATNRLTDFNTLRTLDSGLSSLARTTISRVIIYKAPASGVVPATCTAIAVSAGSTATLGVANTCNVYSPTQVHTQSPYAYPTVTGTPDTCGSGAWDANWCPLGRDQNTPDSIGLWVELKYQHLTSILPTNFTFTRYAVFNIEPPSAGGTQ